MANSDLQFAALMERVQAGCQESTRALHDLYGEHIQRAVRRRLHQKLRSKFDSIDFVQDVWVSFFADIPQKYRFESPSDLVSFLIAMAHNKVTQAVRTRLQRQKHNLNREKPLDSARAAGLRANVPTPSEDAMGNEAWEGLIDKQPLVYRHILVGLRGGKEPAVIAQELGISLRTVRRVIQKYKTGVGS